MAFITRITDYIIDNYNLEKDSLTVIFPNKRAALTLRKELSRRIKRNIWLPKILSIQEAMSSWSGIQLVDNIDIIYQLIKIMNNSLDVSTRSNIFGLASQIVKDFDEIDQYAVDAEDLFRYLKVVKETESWSPHDNMTETEKSYLTFFASLHSYYKQLRFELLENNQGYYGLITRKLYELSNVELEALTGNNKILFAGFNAMTFTEENIIKRFVELEKAVLLWDLDKYYYEDEKQEAGLFARQFFSKNKNIKPDFICDNFKDKHINIIAVSGSSVQADALKLQLNNEINDAVELKNEVVVLSDETLLIPVINSIPCNRKSISVTMGYPYSKTIVNHFVHNLFALEKNIDKDNKIYFWSLKRLLETEIFKIIFNDEEQKLLIKSTNDFLKESNYYITVNEIDKYFVQEKVNHFLKLMLRKWDSSIDCISRLKSILIYVNECITSNDNNFIKNQISVAGRILNKIEKLINKYNVIIQITDIENLYKQSAMEMSIALEKDPNTDVESSLQIMGLLETRNLDFGTVHILSVNEGILPQSKSGNTLIPYDLRLEYNLPIHTNKQAVYAYHFYRLIQNAKNINIYYNILADATGEGEQSRFIQQIINELPRNRNIVINNVTYKTPVPKSNDTIDIEIDKTPDVIEKIKKRLSGTNSKGEKKGLSPTSISCYLKCPLKFYLKYIENVSDNSNTEKLQANIIGNIIHNTFEFLYAKFGAAIVDSDYYDQIVNEHLKNAYNEALKENNFTNGLPKTGFNYLSQVMIDKLIENFIRYEKESLKKGGLFKIIGLEQNLSYTFDIDGSEVNLTGFADRIDMNSNKIRILDYKSGSVKDDDVVIKKDAKSITDLTEKALQLSIYKYLYAKNNNDVSIENIEPGIFGLLKISNPFFPLNNKSQDFDDDNFMDTCDTMFRGIFSEMLDPELPFRQVEDESKCSNCDFLIICKRNPKKYNR